MKINNRKKKIDIDYFITLKYQTLGFSLVVLELLIY